MITPDFKAFRKLCKKGALIPLFKEIPADLDTPVSAFLKIASGENDFLLESVEGGEKWGRYSFLGTKPRGVFIADKEGARLITGKSSKKIPFSKDPLEALSQLLKSQTAIPMDGLPRFFGGAVGFMSYDMARYFEKIPTTAKDDLNIPHCYFLLTDTLLIFDNLKQTIKVVSIVVVDSVQKASQLFKEGEKKIEALISKLKKPLKDLSSLKPIGNLERKTLPKLKANRTEKEYLALVERAKEYVKAGDIFQVQISLRFGCKTKVKPFDLYRAIRRQNPSPYLYFLNLKDLAIVGASPELMVRLEDNEVQLRPIAGTRRRGLDEKEDLALESELRTDPKERAEHIMLVDLGRNDLGRVCKTGSVKVDELETVERYSQVMHLVSHVSGELRKDKDAFDLLRATYPAGTLTGAPKIRAMEIIEELEGLRRGVYGGAVGFIGYTGNMDMAITIRTALFKKGWVYVQAAGGVVYDSIPQLEYKECHNKARAMLWALNSVSK